MWQRGLIDVTSGLGKNTTQFARYPQLLYRLIDKPSNKVYVFFSASSLMNQCYIYSVDAGIMVSKGIRQMLLNAQLLLRSMTFADGKCRYGIPISITGS